jgi:hypothetical protein
MSGEEFRHNQAAHNAHNQPDSGDKGLQKHVYVKRPRPPRW